MEKTKKELRLPDRMLRIEIKRLADDARFEYNRAGLYDIFKIIENKALFIRLPLDNLGCSAFTTYFDGTFAVVCNSSFTLGHERFSCAHELYHIRYDAEVLKREGIVFETKKAEEKESVIDRADVFAAEFLMPEELVVEQFGKLVGVKADEVEARHVVRMMDYFEVSYAAMLKRLVQLDLCIVSKYHSLTKYSSIEFIPKLQELMRSEGADMKLITKTNDRYISKEYLKAARDNYEKHQISYDKLEELLDYLGMSPKELGYMPDWVDEE